MIRTCAASIGAIVILLVVSLSMGDYAIPLASLPGALIGEPGMAQEQVLIVRDIRLPRALLCLCVGLALGVAGALTQAVMRNPLAEPGLLGINGGAALAATLVITVFSGVGEAILPLASFAGAAGMALAIYMLSWRGGTSSLRIILVGIGLSALAGAAVSFLHVTGSLRDVQRAMVWMAGSVYDATWSKVQILAAWLVLPLAASLAVSRDIDLLGFSDAAARSLGQRVNLTRAGVILLLTLLSAPAVAAAGLIGFVGLVAPHVARRLVGPRHRAVLPLSGFVGALLVLAADLAGRTVIAPAQLPAGLMTALVGAPFFGYLMWERRHART